MPEQQLTLIDGIGAEAENVSRSGSSDCYVASGVGVCGHEGSGGKGKSDDWITPKWIIDELGPFDLDPCESDYQPWPCAANGYHKPEGLLLPWQGRVWCNPPYGQQLGDWLERCAKHGNAIALTFARTETRHFFGGVWGKARGVLFLRGRVKFHRPDGTPGAAGTGPSVLIAYGEENAARLRELAPERGAWCAT